MDRRTKIAIAGVIVAAVAIVAAVSTAIFNVSAQGNQSTYADTRSVVDESSVQLSQMGDSVYALAQAYDDAQLLTAKNPELISAFNSLRREWRNAKEQSFRLRIRLPASNPVSEGFHSAVNEAGEFVEYTALATKLPALEKVDLKSARLHETAADEFAESFYRRVEEFLAAANARFGE